MGCDTVSRKTSHVADHPEHVPGRMLESLVTVDRVIEDGS